MISNRELLLVILFQLDKYLEMFPVNCLVEELIFGGEGVGVGGMEAPELDGTNGCGIWIREELSSSASMVHSPSSASGRVIDGLEGKGTKGTIDFGGLFLWDRSSRLVRSSLKTRCILENFMDRLLFFGDVF